MTIEEAVLNLQQLIINNEESELISRIRSSQIINNIHEAVKYEVINKLLINYNINNPSIYPPIGSRNPELQLAGFIKRKKQDICIVPNINRTQELLSGGLLGEYDDFGQIYTDKTLSINVRSQISSIDKNFDTLIERTFAESTNLHLRCHNMVLGEVYLLSIFDFNKDKQTYLSSQIIEKYIKAFHSISDRSNNRTDLHYKYEATCLLIVDFSQPIPKIYNSTQELIDNGFLDSNTTIRYEGLEWNSFFDKILNIYNQRFGLQTLQH